MIDARRVAVIAAVWAVSSALPLAAQRPTLLRPDQRVTGTIVASDRTVTVWGHFKLFSFHGEAGQELRFSVNADGVTPILLVARDVGGFTDWIRTKQGADSSATLRFSVRETADYLLGVFAKEPDAVGSFELNMTASTMNPPVVRPIGRDTTVSGSFTPETAYDDEESETYDYYTLNVSAGDSLAFRMRSSDFDTYLVVGRMENGEFRRLARDDDGLSGTDSKLVFKFEETGEYVIRAASYLEGVGAYTLQVGEPGTQDAETPEPGIDVVGAIPANSTVTGRLPADTGVFNDWSFSASAGARLVIDVMSTELDAVVQLGAANSGTFVKIDEDDDGGDDNNARLVYTPKADENLVIRVRQYGSAGGAYTLAVRQRPVQAPAEPRVVTIARPGTFDGALGDDDARLGDDSYYEHWTYAARQGERLVITVASGDFDPFLAVGEIVEGAFVPVASNDDAPSLGNGSRVIMIARKNATYVIRVNTFGPDQAGVYRLTVESNRH